MPEYSGQERELESLMVELGEQQYHSGAQRAAEMNAESRHGAVRWLVAQAMDPFVESLRSWRESVRKPKNSSAHRASMSSILKEVGVEQAAYLVTQVVFDGISQHRKWASICIQVGRVLNEEQGWQKYRRSHARHFAKLLKNTRNSTRSRRIKAIRESMRIKKIEHESWPIRKRTWVGQFMLLLFIESTGLVEAVVERDDRRLKFWKGKSIAPSVKYIVPTQACIDWLKRAHSKHAQMHPKYLPMVDVPIPWESLYGGGYATDLLASKPVVKVQFKAHEESLEAAGIPPVVLEAVNVAQEVPWEINQDVLEVMDHFWDNQVDVAGLGCALELDHAKFKGDKTSDAYKIWRFQRRKVSEYNRKSRSHRLLVSRLLATARLLEDKVPFYYPHFLDYRGRLYPRPPILNPQGDDKAKGLLRFSEGLPLDTPEAVYWFKVGIANSYGIDKVSFDERTSWVDENTEMIREIHKDPIECRAWASADEPWCFLAFALEYGEFLDDPEGFLSHLPVHQDGSNNGLQIYSLLLRDPVAARATNVISDEAPQDMYKAVAERMEELLDERIGDHFGGLWRDHFRKNGGIPRKLPKRIVMTIPYGLEQWTATTHIQDWYEEEFKVTFGNHPMGIEYRQACKYLGDLTWEATHAIVSSAGLGRDWLQEVASVVAKANIPLNWHSPTGFLCQQAHPKYNKARVRTAFGEKVSSVRIREPRTGEILEKKQVQSFPANFIHSLDAAIKDLVISKCAANGVRSLTTIHDSFGVHASNYPIMARALRESLAEVFSENLLESLREEIQAQLPEDAILPPSPTLGGLDPKAVLQSKYVFS